MENKPWWQSKTLWFNALGMVGMMFGPDGAFGHVFSPAEVGTVMGVGNMILRSVTDKPLGR